jgi:hypothetical protein
MGQPKDIRPGQLIIGAWRNDPPPLCLPIIIAGARHMLRPRPCSHSHNHASAGAAGELNAQRVSLWLQSDSIDTATLERLTSDFFHSSGFRARLSSCHVPDGSARLSECGNSNILVKCAMSSVSVTIFACATHLYD